MKKIAKLQIFVKSELFLTLAVSVILLPVQWILSWCAAALVHECFHYIAIRIMGVKVFSVTVGATGAIMETDTMHPLQEFFCALAGPIGAFAILIFKEVLPYVVLFVCIHSSYNLLPLYPLDGGRALHSLIAHFFGDLNAIRYTVIINNTVLSVLAFLSFLLTIRYQLGTTPMILILLLSLRIQKANYSLQRQKTNSTI